MMCKVLEVSTQGFYAWLKRPESVRHRANVVLAVTIKELHVRSRRRYGSPRVHHALQVRGQRVGRNRVARLMQQQGLRARPKRRFRRTTDSNHQLPVAPNVLARNFTADAPNKAWVTDLTYVWTLEGWLYVAAIVDLFSRRVVGWAMSDSLERQIALDALSMALQSRNPAAGLVHHSDRGSQYASDDYQRVLKARGIVCSMSRKGDCWDNAVAESFFATLKTELVYECNFANRAEAATAIFEFIEVFYNRERFHSSLGYLTPAGYEALANQPHLPV
jgi:putative transposase